jgi:hypothetical protein
MKIGCYSAPTATQRVAAGPRIAVSRRTGMPRPTDDHG